MRSFRLDRARPLQPVFGVLNVGCSTERWHSALGGGLWVSWGDAYLANLAFAHSAEATSIDFGLGFSF